MELRSTLCGTAAAYIAEVCTYPIDLSKTRLQIQGEHYSSGRIAKFNGQQYSGMLNVMYMVSRNEGPLALYTGLTASILRQSVYAPIKFGIYANLKKVFEEDPLKQNISHNFLCAIVAGAVSSAIGSPADLLKIRMQAQAASCSDLKIVQNKSTSSIIHIATELIKSEGIFGLYRGVLPTSLRAAIVCGVELPSYDFFKKNFIRKEIFNDNIGCHFVFLAGLLGAITSNPIDCIRTRIMNQDLRSEIQENKKYHGFISVLKSTIKNEGITALWKGFIPNWLRLGPWNIIFFITFEKFKLLWDLNNLSDPSILD